ncbi:carbon-nitrogen hydrolase family protein [Jiangella ureilytica]|uniref:Carbon-nitrogen hydrolase family protein n=1 Tax=Jiangella ureilytica TaxID=2530374 RepID=A0A4R4RM68_9ACTN|nr:carbon-nitrogen hydrolase family protein [Jiangella ureilytica]TDC50690.1 carbon-nitrogen hydrolase family protein [Jiangella ureilytica]
MDLTVACAQPAPRLGAVAANLAAVRAAATSAVESSGASLVVFPECAVTGYPFSRSDAEAVASPADGEVASALGSVAAALGVHLAVGLIESDGPDLYDALSLFGPDGSRLATYRKAHLFSTERAVYAPGPGPVVVSTDLGTLGLTVCYDLIFPEYVRALVDAGATMIVNATNWITDSWQTDMGWDGSMVRSLARVRALENGVPVVMACLAGAGGGFTSIGHSTIASASGRVLASLGSGEGVAAARVVTDDADARRWSELATYRADRRPDLYG